MIVQRAFPLVLLALAVLPSVASAKVFGFLPDDLVPCGNEVQTVPGAVTCTINLCTPCHFVELAQNFLHFLIAVAVIIAVLLIVNAGILLITAGGNSGQVSKARSMAKSAVIGIIITLSAWLLIDTIMAAVYEPSKLGQPWERLVCPTVIEDRVCTTVRKPLDPDPAPVPHAIGPGYAVDSYTVTADGPALKETAMVAGAKSLQTRCALASGKTCYDAIIEEAVKQGVDPNFALALATIESGGCSNPATCKSKVGATGVIQLMPGTGKQLCGAPCKGYSAAEMTSYLSNPENNIALGVKYMKESQNSARVNELAGGDLNKKRTYMAAFYNGGPGALRESKTCPGKTFFECSNNSGYRETRGYVSNMNRIMNRAVDAPLDAP